MLKGFLKVNLGFAPCETRTENLSPEEYLFTYFV